MEGTAPPIGKYSLKSGKHQQKSTEIADMSFLLDNQELGPFRSSKDSPKDGFLRDSCEHPITLNDNACCEVRDFSIDNLTHNVAV